MTREEKVQLLGQLFPRSSNPGVIAWTEGKSGYWWKCESHDSAQELADSLVANVRAMGLDAATLPLRFHPKDGTTLICEPVDD